ncbi:hypothetical protein KEM54_006561 [Ascosphaera aggregata]|nr:hypothetical protein KEM54_006561 [Ascosphaera aggregata]
MDRRPEPKTYKQLYISRFPFWFILERRFFFADYEGTGKLIISRFNRATAGIEAFNVVVPRLNVAGNAGANGGIEVWEGRENEGWILRSYMPDLQLWYDDPVLVIDSESTKAARRQARKKMNIRPGREREHENDDENDDDDDDDDDETDEGESDSELQESNPETTEIIPWRANGVTMELKSQPATSSASASASAATPLLSSKWASVPWPPTTIPLSSLSQRIVTNPSYAAAPGLSFLSTYGFHLTRSIGFAPQPGGYAFGVNMEVDATYASLDEEVYTPTPSKPLQGIWVGDYSGHGSEFLLLVHRDDYDDKSEGNGQQGAATPQTDEKGDQYSPIPPLRQTATHSRDANIPRGQVSFIIPDLSPANGLIRMATESPFTGSPVFRGKGHIARNGFLESKWIDVEVIMVSVNVLAVVWVEMGVVAYLKRVDIRELWAR